MGMLGRPTVVLSSETAFSNSQVSLPVHVGVEHVHVPTVSTQKRQGTITKLPDMYLEGVLTLNRPKLGSVCHQQ